MRRKSEGPNWWWAVWSQPWRGAKRPRATRGFTRGCVGRAHVFVGHARRPPLHQRRLAVGGGAAEGLRLQQQLPRQLEGRGRVGPRARAEGGAGAQQGAGAVGGEDLEVVEGRVLQRARGREACALTFWPIVSYTNAPQQLGSLVLSTPSLLMFPQVERPCSLISHPHKDTSTGSVRTLRTSAQVSSSHILFGPSEDAARASHYDIPPLTDSDEDGIWDGIHDSKRRSHRGRGRA